MEGRPKKQLGELIRQVGEVFTVSEASQALNLTTTEAAKKMARWKNQGWLTRIKRGLYAVVPIDAITSDRVLADTWVLVPILFGKAYIGGWTAAEYWDFTEQLFRDVCVITQQAVPNKAQKFHNASFFLTHIKNATTFGAKTIWRQEKKILISDPHKTIIDMLYDPRLGGGGQHVIDCFKEYIKSSHFNAEILGNYAEKLNNGAIFKRLGFLCEIKLGKNHLLTSLCRSHLTKGNVYFDPQIKQGSLVTRWKLFIPVNMINTE